MSRYEYTARNPGQIRLLHLESASDQAAELHCRLVTATLAEISAFEALSYVWGSPENPRILFCDGMAFGITANLDSALRACRQFTAVRTLWVDAVCINQNDDVEKAQQIHLMKILYEQALHCVIYLGDPDVLIALWQEARGQTGSASNAAGDKSHGMDESHIEALFQRFHSLRRILRIQSFFHIWKNPNRNMARTTHDQMYGDGWKDFRSPDSSARRGGRLPYQRIILPLLRRRNAKFAETWEVLFSSPWFQRVWTLQEVILNRAPIIMCGVHATSAILFTRAMDNLHLRYTAAERLAIWRFVAQDRRSTVAFGDLENSSTDDGFTKMARRFIKAFIFLAREDDLKSLHRSDGISASHQMSAMDQDLERRDSSVDEWQSMLEDADSGVTLSKVLMLVMHVRELSATNHFDHVFGALALFERFDTHLGRPDYTQGESAVFAQATLRLMQQFRTLFLLIFTCTPLDAQAPGPNHYVDARNVFSSGMNGGTQLARIATPHLASWAIDWTLPCGRQWFDTASKLIRHVANGKSATGNSKFRRDSVADDEYSAMLILNGLLVSDPRMGQEAVQCHTASLRHYKHLDLSKDANGQFSGSDNRVDDTTLTWARWMIMLIRSCEDRSTAIEQLSQSVALLMWNKNLDITAELEKLWDIALTAQVHAADINSVPATYSTPEGVGRSLNLGDHTYQKFANRHSALQNKEALQLATHPAFDAVVTRSQKSNHATVHPKDLWSVAAALHDLCLFVTSSGHLGFSVIKDVLIDGSLRPEQQDIDGCRLLLAERSPFVLVVKVSQSGQAILRDQSTLQLVGVAFVINWMDGQKWEDEEQNRREYVMI